jgi:outer membrane protein assembly factor BamB
VAGGRIFVCAEPYTLLCLDAADGRILWERTHDYLDLLTTEQAAEARASIEAAATTQKDLQKAEQALRRFKNDKEERADPAARAAKLGDLERKVAELEQQLGPVLQYRPPVTEPRQNGYSTPTPVSDGQHVWALFGNGVLACYDLAGERRWGRIVERPTDEYGHSSSPRLVNGTLLTHITRLSALDPATGKLLWQSPAKHAYGTVTATVVGNDVVVITPGGEVTRLSDGQVLTTKSSSVYHASPVAAGEAVYYMEGKAHAVHLAPSKKKPNTVKREHLWNVELPGERYYASAVVDAGLVFALSQYGHISALDAKTGAVLQQRQLVLKKGAIFYPSLSLAGGRLYATSDDGTTSVVSADRELRLLATNHLEPCRASLVFAGNRLFVRGESALWCIGEPAVKAP